MEEVYDFKKSESVVARLWEKSDYVKPHGAGRSFSTFLNPPNASGPMHIGNALMIAIQDVLVRYQRAKGVPTVWIPGTDHGGYETQVTFEQELESKGASKDDLSREDFYNAVSTFVDGNNETIKRQAKAMGASVDWSAFRFTLDDASLAFVHRIFKKMIEDGLIYRDLYMVYYCPQCATVLADIELKEVESPSPLYHVAFKVRGEDYAVTFATSRPEFIFSVTHMLAHPQDKSLAPYIGKTLVNPATGEDVQVVASKRKFDASKQDPIPMLFVPSYSKYDFEYAIRNNIPSRNLFDWDGTMLERYPGATQMDARAREVEYLTNTGAIVGADETYQESWLTCKKGHTVQSVLRMTWFLKLDDGHVSIRRQAQDAIAKESLIVYPGWRKEGLIEWIGKMHDWPIARQNVWGIRIPLWYKMTDAKLFTVWFIDAAGTRRNGNLETLLAEGVSFDEIAGGLERMYAAEGAEWSLTPGDDAQYLQETDTFDTWFSSSAWATIVFDSVEYKSFYPSDVIFAGHDLLRLWVARTILLGVYMSKRLPFKRVYFNSIIRAKDGQKMSKSLGNAVTLDHYLETFGADVTRMALVSYTAERGDFHMSDQRLYLFKEFAERLWTMARISDTANTYAVGPYATEALTPEDKQLLADLTALGETVGTSVEKYFLAQAQEKLVTFLERFEQFNANIQSRDDDAHAVAVFHSTFRKYISILHPFMPFMTEAVRRAVYTPGKLLAEAVTQQPVRRR